MNLDTLYSAWNTQRDNDTLKDLILAVRNHTKGYFRRLGAEAEDIAQDVAILVLGKLPEFSPHSESSFSHWIAAILRRRRLHSYQTKRLIYRETTPEITLDEEANPFVDISELPPDIREAANHILQGYSIEQSAERKGLKPGTLRKRLHAYRNR